MLSTSPGKTLAVSTYRLAPSWVGEVSGDKLLVLESVSRHLVVPAVIADMQVPDTPAYEIAIPATVRVLAIPKTEA